MTKPRRRDAGVFRDVYDVAVHACVTGGLEHRGSITGGCRSTGFLDTSNTLHRHACIASGGSTYCGPFYALYFLRDQISALGGGHRHDWEYAAIWTRDGVVTHAGYSAHGDLHNAEVGTLARVTGHVKFVYHKDGASTHALRFAGAGEPPGNPYGQFLAPLVTSWYEQTRGSQVLPSPRCKSENCPRRHRRLPSDPTSETGVQHGIASWPPGGSPAARRA
jgi:hypothetical protein